MNKYSYDNLKIGMSECFQVKVTEDKMKLFQDLSGDTNPLHCSEEFAKQKGFIGRVAYGMLSSSFYSKLIGVYLPGENSLIYDMKISYHKPVYIDDVLDVQGIIVEKNDLLYMVTVNCVITNQVKEKVSKAKINVKLI